jgi:hypothetical protein
MSTDVVRSVLVSRDPEVHSGDAVFMATDSHMTRSHDQVDLALRGQVEVGGLLTD